MTARKAYRYAIRDDWGRTILARDWVPARLSDVKAERVGNVVTLYDDAQVLEQVEVDPAMGKLVLERWALSEDGVVSIDMEVRRRVPVVDVG